MKPRVANAGGQRERLLPACAVSGEDGDDGQEQQPRPHRTRGCSGRRPEPPPTRNTPGEPTSHAVAPVPGVLTRRTVRQPDAVLRCTASRRPRGAGRKSPASASLRAGGGPQLRGPSRARPGHDELRTRTSVNHVSGSPGRADCGAVTVREPRCRSPPRTTRGETPRWSTFSA